MNRRSRKGSSSQFKGVFWEKRKRKWKAAIYYNGRNIHLGYFQNEPEAAQSYDDVAIKLFGKFALLNQPSVESAEIE